MGEHAAPRLHTVNTAVRVYVNGRSCHSDTVHCDETRDRLHNADHTFNNQAVPWSHTHTHPFNGPLSTTTWVSQYQKGRINLDFTEARDSEWQWHQLGRMQVCTLHQTYNHVSTPALSFLQAGCPSCHPTNSVKACLSVTQHTNTNCALFVRLYNSFFDSCMLSVL